MDYLQVIIFYWRSSLEWKKSRNPKPPLTHCGSSQWSSSLTSSFCLGASHSDTPLRTSGTQCGVMEADFGRTPSSSPAPHYQNAASLGLLASAPYLQVERMTWTGRMEVRSVGSLKEWVRERFQGFYLLYPGAENTTPLTPPHHRSHIGTSGPDSVSTLEDKSPLSRRSCWKWLLCAHVGR